MVSSFKGPFRAGTNPFGKHIVVDERTGKALWRAHGSYRKIAITHKTSEAAQKKADRLNREWQRAQERGSEEANG